MTAARIEPSGGHGRQHPSDDGYEHLTPLLVEFAATAPEDARHRALRNELAAGFWPVVLHIARRYRNRGEPPADLEQVGPIGLTGAPERFGPDRATDSLSDLLGTVDDALTVVECRHELRAALDDLPERERAIVVLRFFGDMTQTQIGAHVGLSQMHVSRLSSQTTATLRERIGTA